MPKVTMPQLGESVAEGTIGKWLKQVGDHVDKYEPIVEVVTDKVNAEVPSPFEGTLTADPRPGGRDGPQQHRDRGHRGAGDAPDAAAASAPDGHAGCPGRQRSRGARRRQPPTTSAATAGGRRPGGHRRHRPAVTGGNGAAEPRPGGLRRTLRDWPPTTRAA